VQKREGEEEKEKWVRWKKGPADCRRIYRIGYDTRESLHGGLLNPLPYKPVDLVTLQLLSFSSRTLIDLHFVQFVEGRGGGGEEEGGRIPHKLFPGERPRFTAGARGLLVTWSGRHRSSPSFPSPISFLLPSIRL